jgi:hypothetical protein
MGFVPVPGNGADDVRDNESKHAVEEEQKKDNDDDNNDELKQEDPESLVSECLMAQGRRCYQLKPWVSPLGPPNRRFTILRRRCLLASRVCRHSMT